MWQTQQLKLGTIKLNIMELKLEITVFFFNTINT